MPLKYKLYINTITLHENVYIMLSVRKIQQQVKTRNHEAYLEITEKPFIAVVVGIFGVVLVHSSSASWTKQTPEQIKILLQRK